MLKPQDIVVALKLLGFIKKPSYEQLASSLSISKSEAHGAIKRLQAAQLVNQDLQVNRGLFYKLLVYAVPYIYYPKVGKLARGFITGTHKALANEVRISPDDKPFIWAHSEGNVRGQSIEPLFRKVPDAIQHDETLYRLLALVDCLRVGKARERNLAAEFLKKEVLENEEPTI